VILTAKKIQELMRQGENESVEFKTALRDASTLAKSISAFANTHGGTLLIGVREPDVVVGAVPDQVTPLLEKSKTFVTPSLDVDVSSIVIEGKPVVAVTVPESQQVVFSNGMALKRVRDQVRPLSPRDISMRIATPASVTEIERLAGAIAKQTETIEILTE
jgi:predicted HTH transcriptional regulator